MDKKNLFILLIITTILALIFYLFTFSRHLAFDKTQALTNGRERSPTESRDLNNQIIEGRATSYPSINSLPLSQGVSQSNAGSELVEDELRATNLKSTSKFEILNSKFESPIPNSFLDPVTLFKVADIQPEKLQGTPVAGVVNHHALAADFQSRFFRSLAASRPDIKTFIIISPDHYLSGQGISFHTRPYATSYGDVGFDARWLFALESAGAWQSHDQSFDNEHGVGALAPYIARDFPDAVIVPIFLSSNLSRAEAMVLGQRFSASIDASTFVIISSDMSHYLTHDQALSNDKITLQNLQSNNWPDLSKMRDSFTDSAVGFTVLGSLLDAKYQSAQFNILDHGISSDYGTDPSFTTSYITGFWTIKNPISR